MYYPNMYGSMPQMQNRLMQMEQNYGPMPSQLPGHIVSSMEEARAQQIIPNGNSYYFPSPSENRIYEKSTDMNGQPIFKVYAMTEIPVERPVTAACVAALEKRLSELEQALGVGGGKENESIRNAGNAATGTGPNGNAAKHGGQ